jgi:DNA ligase-1
MKPMLACEADLPKLKFPVLASPKLDGVRALVRDGGVLSRSLKPIPNRHVQMMFGRPELEGFDGELILGDPTHPEAYRRTVSAVMSIEGEHAVDFHVFDRWDREYPYKEVSLSYWLIIPIYSTPIHNMEKLEEYEVAKLDKGYEGVMLRDPQSPYKFGRSTAKEGYLLKLKRFADSEAEIIGFEELMHNQNEATLNETGHIERSTKQVGLLHADTLGALIVRDIHSGVEFKIGTGFTAAERQKFWNIRATLRGALVKYLYFPTGSKVKPRFPSFQGFRHQIDL